MGTAEFQGEFSGGHDDIVQEIVRDGSLSCTRLIENAGILLNNAVDVLFCRMTQSDGALDYDAQMKFQGIWKLSGDKLTESMTVEVVSATSNGAPMADEAKAMLRNGLGAEQVSTVKVTGPDAMALINPVYGLGCTRA